MNFYILLFIKSHEKKSVKKTVLTEFSPRLKSESFWHKTVTSKIQDFKNQKPKTPSNVKFIAGKAETSLLHNPYYLQSYKKGIA